MLFILARYAAIFCGVAFLVALCADVVQFIALSLLAHYSGRGAGYFLGRGEWLVLFAIWWMISFPIAVPLARKFTGLPISLF